MSEIIDNIYTKVHIEVRNDIDAFLRKEQSDVFSGKRYFRNLAFNSLINFTNLPTEKYKIYDGGLGMGHYIHIYFNIDGNYSLEFSCFDDSKTTVEFTTENWDLLKEKVDEYFESIMH